MLIRVSRLLSLVPGGAILDDAARLEAEHALGGADRLGPVRDDDPGCGKRRERLVHRLLARDVEMAGRLVEE
jgi:hypothetical protein